MKTQADMKRELQLREAGRDVAVHMGSLFARCPDLWGFAVTGDEEDIFTGHVGIAPALNAEQYAEIYEQIIGTLAELVAERPESRELLCGRTFTRVLH
jgi:hypothetical protein